MSSRHQPGQGGVGACVDALVRGAVDIGWHVELMTRAGHRLPPANKVHIVETADEREHFATRVPSLRRIGRIRPYRYGLWALAVAERLAERPFDVDAVLMVDVQAEGYVATRSVKVRERLSGAPIIVASHCPMFLVEDLTGKDRRQYGRSIYHDWERNALNDADGVVGLSGMLLDELRIDRPRRAIPPVLRPISRTRSAAHEPVIALVGDVALHKGVDVWARSLNRVLRQVKDVRARLIGPDTAEGPGKTSLAAHLLSLIEPRFRGRFDWAGALSHGETLEAIERAALVVAPSRFDSFSRVAAERLLMGQPVIVSDRVGIGEVVDGLPTVAAGHVESLAEAQIRVLRESATWRRRAAHAREQLLEACAPRRVLGLLASFVCSLGSRDTLMPPANGMEAMDEMRAFLHDVEREERQAQRHAPARRGRATSISRGGGR